MYFGLVDGGINCGLSSSNVIWMWFCYVMLELCLIDVRFGCCGGSSGEIWYLVGIGWLVEILIDR